MDPRAEKEAAYKQHEIEKAETEAAKKKAAEQHARASRIVRTLHITAQFARETNFNESLERQLQLEAENLPAFVKQWTAWWYEVARILREELDIRSVGEIPIPDKLGYRIAWAMLEEACQGRDRDDFANELLVHVRRLLHDNARGDAQGLRNFFEYLLYYISKRIVALPIDKHYERMYGEYLTPYTPTNTGDTLDIRQFESAQSHRSLDTVNITPPALHSTLASEARGLDFSVNSKPVTSAHGSNVGSSSQVPSTASVALPPEPESPDIFKGDDYHVRRSPDYTWLVVNGETFNFSKGNQAETIKALFEVWIASGCHDGCGMTQESLQSRLGTHDGFRVAVNFQGNPALNTILRRVSKGVYALYLRVGTTNQGKSSR